MINIYNHQRKAAQKIVCIYIMNQNILKLQVGEKKKKMYTKILSGIIVTIFLTLF